MKTPFSRRRFIKTSTLAAGKTPSGTISNSRNPIPMVLLSANAPIRKVRGYSPVRENAPQGTDSSAISPVDWQSV
jgi:hypothetical protein